MHIDYCVLEWCSQGTLVSGGKMCSNSHWFLKNWYQTHFGWLKSLIFLFLFFFSFCVSDVGVVAFCGLHIP